MREVLTKSMARNIFYGGSLFFILIFVALSVHSHYYIVNVATNKATLTASVAAGKHVWERNSCINCHSMLGEGAYFAPELGNVMTRWGVADDPEAAFEVTKGWMEAQPSGIEGRRQMPQFNLSDEEIQNLTDFLMWTEHDPHAGLAPERRRLRREIMKYQTQSIAKIYFIVAMALFLVQVSGGLLAGWIYVMPNTLSELVPFNIVRMLHTNSLVVWLLLGFFGAAYFIVPEEAENEIYSPMLAYVQLAILVLGTLGVVVTYLFNLFEGSYLFGTQGREFLEQPTWVKIGIVVAALIFLFNVSMTVLKGRKTAIANVLLLGLWGLALLFLFAFYNPANLSLDKQYWWYVIHLWVEGVWELIMASILAFLMLKLTGVDREVVEKWLYVIVATALFSGILGTGHHYYWIGTPGYWQWIGSIFSSLEIVPFFAMMAFAFVMVWKGKRDHPNKAALLWSLGTATLAFFGAGIWGFLHTLHGVNYYSHGTQITAAHAHLAFYGAYVCLNCAIFTYAMPILLGRDPYNQVLNMASFWLMSGGVVFMTFTLTFAGTVQTHLQRVLGMDFMGVQDQLAVFYWMRFGAGIVVVLGAILFIYAVLVPRREVISKSAHVAAE